MTPTPTKKRILFLAHRVPYPPNRGDRIRSFHLIQWLAARADVSLAYLTDEAPPTATTDVLTSLCSRVAHQRLGRARWLRAAASAATGKTATEGLFRSPALKQTIARWATETPFDAVVVFCSSMVQYLDIPELADVPTVVDLVDVDSQKWLDYAAHARGAKRWLFNLEARRLRQLESSLPERVQTVTVVAEREADVFESFSSYRPYVLSNGVDLDYFHPQNNGDGERPPSCVFVGALDYDANVDGASWFCREIWPHVLQQHPQAVFRIVGSRPNAQARNLGNLPGVELVGEVPDVRPYMQAATAVTVPLRVARGVQNKVLEALAAGKPVMVTPQALEGINAEADSDLICATSAADWAQGICELFTDSARRERLATAGRAFVEREYRWSHQLAKLAQLPGLDRCLNDPPIGIREPASFGRP